MTLRWTFDERVEDGLVAGYALKLCKQILEDPRRHGALPDPALTRPGLTPAGPGESATAQLGVGSP